MTVLTVLYSLAGLGIAIVNDFKSIEGDRSAALGPHPSSSCSDQLAGRTVEKGITLWCAVTCDVS